MENIDKAWQRFKQNPKLFIDEQKKKSIVPVRIPKCGELKISTKTMIAFLNVTIDLKDVFWKLKMIDYYTKETGIIKKQMKINCKDEEEAKQLEYNIKQVTNEYIQSTILKQNDGKIGFFRDNRKISIGISNKDLINTKNKQSGAFYNCFVLIVRIFEDNKFKEIHVKIFNTGKLEIPGIQKNATLFNVLKIIISVLQVYYEETVTYNVDQIDTVLINSNFNCGYFINRNILYNILKYKYNINVIYDPCSYPGIQCKYYYNKDKKLNNGLCDCKVMCTKKQRKMKQNNCWEISFMIFRTGSVLIVGNSTEFIIHFVYDFIKNIFETEFSNIFIKIRIKEPSKKKKKKHLTIRITN